MSESIFMPNSQLKQYNTLIDDLPEICHREEIADINRLSVVDDNEIYSTSTKKIVLSLTNHKDIKRLLVNSTGRPGDTFKNLDAALDLDISIEILDIQGDSNISNFQSFKKEKLIKLPVYTVDGMFINGQQYKFITTLEAERGFQIKKLDEKNKDDGSSYLSLDVVFRPTRGTEINIRESRLGRISHYIVKTKRKGVSNSEELSLIALLKAYSGKDISEILHDISISNGICEIDPLFKGSEDLSTNKCRMIALHTLIPYQEGVEYLDIDQTFDTRIAKNNYFKLTQSAKENAKRIFSYSSRCYNSTLAAPVNVEIDGEKKQLDSGTFLTHDLLDALDNDNIPYIIIDVNGKKVRITNYPLSDYLDYNYLVNVANIIATEKNSINPLNNIDSIQSKKCYCSYVYLKEFLDTKLDELMNIIIQNLSKQDDDNFYINLNRDDFNFFNYYRSAQARSNVACIQGVVGRNTLSDSSGDYKVTSSLKEPTLAARAVHLENAFFLDSQASPESEKAGITQHLSSTAFVNKDGHLANYFLKVKNGKVTDEKVVLTSIQAYYEHIYPNMLKDTDDVVEVIYKDSVVKCNVGKITYVPLVPLAINSPAISIGVGVNSNKGRRAQMAGNHVEQYVPILGGERHYVTTGMSSFIEGKIIRCDEILQKLCLLNSVEEASIDGIRLTEKSILPETICLTFQALDPALTKTLTIKVDYLKTIMQMVQSYEINVGLRDEPIWYKDEIVVYPMDYDCNEREVTMPEDIITNYQGDGYGYLDREQIRKSISEKDLAMGLSLLVGFISWNGYCYEDGILIRQGLVDSMKLSNVFTHTIEHELREGEFVYNNGLQPNLDSNGYPIKGNYYADGATILCIATNNTSNSNIINSHGDKTENRIKSIVVPSGYGGFVQAYDIVHKRDGKEIIRITVGGIKNLEVGDKLTGHHGNKGVITKVLPDSSMPCLEDGTPLDICVNPLGVPSRMNIGQLLEVSLGLKDRYKVLVAPTYTDNATLYDALYFNDLKEDNLVTLYDNETLKPLPNKVNVGYMYFMKLDHSVSKKLNFISTAEHVDSKTGQPRKSDSTPGGQSISEYAMNAILANGAYKTADYLYACGSDDRPALKRMVQDLRSKGYTDIIGINKTYDLALAYLRTVGINLKGGTEEGMKFTLLTDTDIAEMSEELSLTSSVSNLLHHNPASMIKNRRGELKASRSKYTHINCGNIAWLNPALLNPVFSKLFYVLFDKGKTQTIKRMSLKTVKGIINGKYYVKIDDYNGIKTIFVYDVKYTELIADSLTGGAAMLYLAQNYSKEDMLNFIKNENLKNLDDDTDDIEDSDDILESDDSTDQATMLDDESDISNNKDYDIWKNLQSPKEFITNKLLLLPAGLRPETQQRGITDSMNLILSKAIKMLQDIPNPGVNLKDNPTALLSVSSTFLSAYNRFYKYWYSVCVKSELNEYFDKSVVKTPWELIKNKESGIIRNGILKKRINFSGRSTIVGVPELKLDEAYIPKRGIYKTYENSIISWIKNAPELELLANYFSDKELLKIIDCYRVNNISYLVHLFETNYFMLRKQNEEPKKEYIDGEITLTESNINKTYLSDYKHLQHIGELIEDIVKDKIYDERIILIREPALHRQNAQSYKIRMWNNRTIGINTLVCASYNADFDGDQMAAIAVMPEECKKECDETLAPSNLLTEDRKGGNNYTLRQDCVLGFYTATNTIPKESTVTEYFSSTDKLKKAIENRDLDLRTVISVNFDGKDLVTTAGRAYVAITLEGYLDVLKNNPTDAILDSKKLDKIIMSDCEHKSKEECIEYLNDLKMLGFKLQDLNNTTISIEDFKSLYSNPKVKNTLVNRNDKAILTLKAVSGFLSNVIDKERVSDDIFNKEMVSIFKSELNKDSNLFRIMNSGARGGFNNLSEPLISGGYIKDLQDNLVPTSIKGNLLNGLDPLGVFLSGFEVRRAQLSTTLSTKNAGVMTRTLIFVANDEIITTDDCGAEPQPHMIYFEPEPSLEEEFFTHCSAKTLASNSPGFSYLGSRKMDKGCFNALITHLEKELIFTDGTHFQMKYVVDELTYNQYIGRLGYKYNDHSEQILLTKDLINEYVEAGETEIFVRTTYDCKCDNGICSHCYGKDIHNENEEDFLPINRSIGVIAAEVIGEILSQMAMDVKNKSSEQDTATNVVDRVQQIVKLGKSQHLGSSYYAPFDGIVSIKDYGNLYKIHLKTVNDKKSKDFKPIPKGRILVGDNVLVKKGDKLIDGENVYGILQDILDFDFLRTEIFKEINNIIESLGESIDVRYIELLVHAMTRNSVIVDSNGHSDLVPGRVLDTNIAKQYERDFGVKTSNRITNYVESNLGRGLLKALCGQNPQNEISLGLIYNYTDPGNSCYSKIFLGLQMNKSAFNFVLKTPKVKVNVSHTVTEQEEIVEEMPETNFFDTESESITQFFETNNSEEHSYNEGDKTSFFS